MSTNLVIDDQGTRIRRFPNGLWYVKPQGKDEYSAKASNTLVKAQEHLLKLGKGLVHFNPLSEREVHNPAFRNGSNFCNGSGPKSRLSFKP